MTILQPMDPTGSGRCGHARSLALAADLRANRYRAGVQWPHVGERIRSAGIAFLGMVKQRNGSRVSAAGDAR